MDKELLKNHKFQFVRYCYVTHNKALKKSHIHINDDSHILHVCKGEGTVFINGQAYPLKKGVVVSIPSFTEFYFSLAQDFEMQNIHYKIWANDGETLDKIKTLPFVFSPGYFKYCEETLKKMEKCRSLPYPGCLKIEVLAHKLIIRHLCSNTLEDSPLSCTGPGIGGTYRRLQSADCVRYKAAKLAASCFLSVSQMNRKFKEHFKISPRAFWEKSRFFHICHALDGKEMNIAEISAKFDFSDQAHFSKWFRKMSGLSPREYRRNLSKTNFKI